MISCIVPFYNELKRIDSVLNALIQTKNIDEIICVNDGSTDQTTRSLRKKYTSVNFIDKRKSTGKSAAVKYGLKYTHGEIILLLDADLQNLDHLQIDDAICKMKKKPDLDMLILRETNPFWTTKISRHDIILSGKRLLKKADLAQIFRILRPQNYQLEIAINKYMIKYNKKVMFSDIDCRNIIKSEKIGLAKGIYFNYEMLKSVYHFAGPKDYLWQIAFFSHERV